MKLLIKKPGRIPTAEPRLAKLIVRGGSMQHFSSGMKMIYTRESRPSFVVFGHMDGDGNSVKGVNYVLDLESRTLVDKNATEMKSIYRF